MIDYNFDALGWYQFERLCQATLGAAHGARIEAWGGTQDRGRDAYASGPIRYPDQALEDGPFVFQVKFIESANAAGSNAAPGLTKAVRSECERILERRAEGIWQSPRWYTLMTNVVLTPRLRDEIRALINGVDPTTTVLFQGATELAAILDALPSVRISYPQILGIRDLDSLLEKAVARDVRERSALAIASGRRLARVFVPTTSYNQALRRLGEYGFAVLLGPPEMGKTAIARMISLARHATGWEAYDCRNPSDFFKVYAKDRSQIFVADDAFGSTEYRPEIAAEWAASLDKIIDATDGSHHFLWTSRPAPLREGLQLLHFQGSADHFPEPSEVEVNARRLSIAERALMLYRHAKANDLDDDAREIIRRHCRKIISSPHFTPLRIDRFVREQLLDIVNAPTADRAELLDTAISEGLREPTKAMTTSFGVLDDEHKAVLYGLLNSGSTLIRPEEVERWAETFLGRSLNRSAMQLIEDVRDHFVHVVEP